MKYIIPFGRNKNIPMLKRKYYRRVSRYSSVGAIVCLSFTLMLIFPLCVYASNGNISNVINNTFAFNLEEVKTDVLNLVGVGAPYALGIMGIMLSLKLGVRFFRKTSK